MNWGTVSDLLNVKNFTPAGFEENKTYLKKSAKFVQKLIATKFRI